MFIYLFFWLFTVSLKYLSDLSVACGSSAFMVPIGKELQSSENCANRTFNSEYQPSLERISLKYDAHSEYVKYEVFKGQQMTIVHLSFTVQINCFPHHFSDEAQG